ncbi:MAG: hypothetical protein NC347_08800 [Clostridium sp.]|nr:hypothetical protein [Clostridium sp.]
MGKRIKRIAKKIGKGFLWLLKLVFVLLCLRIWWELCIPMAETIIPAVYDQCVYHEFAEEFLEEKYGEHINVHNKRLPLTEMNSANFYDYEYSFNMNGKTYQFIYHIGNYGNGAVFYGDNAQYDEIDQLVAKAIDKVRYNRTLSDFDRIDWRFSEEIKNPSFTMFQSKYTGDNLHEFPVRIYLYWDKKTVFYCNREILEELYTSVTEDLALYDIDCKEIHIYCVEQTDYYYITKTSEGIKVEDKKY